ncbi:reverse transcriptase domain-containing protein [Tanacetum coccineum]
MEDASDEPLIIKAVMERYLVRMVYIDQGASVEVMFEHCFENLSPAIRSRLRGTQMDLVGFAGGVLKPLRKIKLEVVFGDGGLFKTVMINFTVVREPSPYNVIFGRTGLRSLRAVSLKIHSMVKFPNPRESRPWSLGQPSFSSVEDMMGIPRRIIEHSLNVNPSVEPVAQTRRVLASDRTQVVSKEVEEWVNAGIVHPVRYPTWISNPVLVKKSDGSWMMCIDFKNINSACPKDYYPLSDIDEKIESVVGFRYKCFLDAYKGYHQVQMAQDDEEKTAFYMDQGTLVDTALQSQIGRNLEAYVDDMVIKSNDEKILIEDIAVIFDNLWRINMKLNPKKCSFGVEEGKFLGYMVTSKGIWDITKENKDEYCWTESAEKAFQEMKKVIVEMPLLTTPVKEETLYIYVAAATEAVIAVLLAEKKGKQCSIHYVSRTLNEAERNYASLEKLALSLLHMSWRLRRYFEAHPIKVITDQPLKQILNKAQASGKLAKYSVELGAYNIIYEPRNVLKGQVLANFLSEAPVGTPTEEFFRLPAKLTNKDDVERWTLFIDWASNNKGSRAALVLIRPSGVEFMYALRLNFANTNKEAEYEALLAGLRMARKIKVQNIDVKVDSKLVASQINGSYVASSTSMIKYLATTKECIAKFETFAIQNKPRNLNQKADILSKLVRPGRPQGFE